MSQSGKSSLISMQPNFEKKTFVIFCDHERPHYKIEYLLIDKKNFNLIMDERSCFWHILPDTYGSIECRLCHRYIGNCANYCEKCVKEKGICKVCGKSPVFDRDEAYNRVADLRVIIGSDNMGKLHLI